MISQKQNDTLIIIPVFNEEASICGVIDVLLDNYKKADILVINDGSSDKTTDVLSNKRIIVMNHPFNMGIGASFQTGCQFALAGGYDYIIRLDGDGQHDVSFIHSIITPVKNGECDISIGSRFLDSSEYKSTFPRQIGIVIIAKLLSLITKNKVTDPTSGFYAMNKKACEFFAKECVEDYPEPEILTYYRNFRITEVPIAVLRRQGGISSITPLKSIYYMYKVLFSMLLSCFRRK